MIVGREEFGPIRVGWADAAASALSTLRMPRILGEQQARRYASLSGVRARRFLAGRWLLAELIAELTDETDLGFTTTCERCGADHGRPRLERCSGGGERQLRGQHGRRCGITTTRMPRRWASTSNASQAGVRTAGSTTSPRLFAPAAAPDTQGWTLIEAALKADGRGVSVDLAEVHVGEVGTGRWPGARAVRIPGRLDSVDAAVIVGPSGFVLSAAMVPAARERHPE